MISSASPKNVQRPPPWTRPASVNTIALTQLLAFVSV
jgi:hypothetical protein